MRDAPTLLVPLDGSLLAERALPFARAIARMFGGQIVMVRAAEAHVPPGLDPSEAQIAAVREAEAYLQALADEHVPDPCPLAMAVPYGGAAESILLETGIRDADLIVMSTHGRGGLGRMVLGSVATEVLRQATIPLIVIPADARASWPSSGAPRALVAFDGSELSKSVIADAVGLFGNAPGTLTFIRAVPPNTSYEEAAMLDELTRLRTEHLADQIDIGVRLTYGEPASVIIAAARDLEADVIAIATHGRSGMSRLLLGSVAEQVIRSSPVPVLVRRPNLDGTEGERAAPELPLI